MNQYFPEVKKNFGFGCMRLPMAQGEVDREEMCRMVDAFLAAGFNYFDTAHGYLDGKSEKALKECLTSRYPREKYILTNKLSNHFFNAAEEIRPLFQTQMEACGVEYFDFYLMHAQNANSFEKYKRLGAYDTAQALKAEGKIRHVGISFHDTAEVLDRILTERPEIEVVQIQFNYVDFEDPKVQSRACYEVCRKHGKPVIVMEPVKGGNLVNLPEDAAKVLAELGGGSPASYAIRFAAGFEGMAMVLSGMGNMDMMLENTGFMADFKPLDRREQAAVAKVCAIFNGKGLIPCTACRYCTEQCPQGIPIPELFAAANARKIWGGGHETNVEFQCLKCGLCEEICPQHLPIRELLESAIDLVKVEEA